MNSRNSLEWLTIDNEIKPNQKIIKDRHCQSEKNLGSYKHI